MILRSYAYRSSGVSCAVSQIDLFTARPIVVWLEHLLQVFGLELEAWVVGAITGVVIIFIEHPARLGLAFDGLDSADDEALDYGLHPDFLLLFKVFDFVQESCNLFVLD